MLELVPTGWSGKHFNQMDPGFARTSCSLQSRLHAVERRNPWPHSWSWSRSRQGRTPIREQTLGRHRSSVLISLDFGAFWSAMECSSAVECLLKCFLVKNRWVHKRRETC